MVSLRSHHHARVRSERGFAGSAPHRSPAGHLRHGVLFALASLLPGLPAAHAVDLPRPGVVCDAAPQICYDSRGPSLGITRMVYGDAAARQLLAQLSGRPPEPRFLLSEGQLCDLNLRTCWDDGWRQRRVNTILSRHLFGAAAQVQPGPIQPNPSPYPSAADRQCALMQRMRPVISGRCTLSRQSEGFWTTYLVRLDGGQIYRFQRRGLLLLLSDATGNWPVSVRDLGNRVQFRWADLQLEVAQAPMPRGAAGAAPPSGEPGQAPSPTPRSTGEAGGDLLDRLFP